MKYSKKFAEEERYFKQTLELGKLLESMLRKKFDYYDLQDYWDCLDQKILKTADSKVMICSKKIKKGKDWVNGYSVERLIDSYDDHGDPCFEYETVLASEKNELVVNAFLQAFSMVVTEELIFEGDLLKLKFDEAEQAEIKKTE